MKYARSLVSFAPRSPRIARWLRGAALLPLCSVLAGCPFTFSPDEADAEDDSYGYDDDDSTYSGPASTSSSAGTRSGATSATQSPARASSTTPASTTPARPASSSSGSSSPAPSSSAATASSRPAPTATCGSNCTEEANVRTETRRCAAGASQGPCYCAAALTYLCFYMNDCYAEAGAPTNLSEATLDQGFSGELSKAADVDYACKYTANGITLNLNDVDTGSASSDAAPADEGAADAPQAEEPVDRCAGKNPCAFAAR